MTNNQMRFSAHDPATREAIAAYQTHGDPTLIEPILHGLARYYIPPEAGLQPGATAEQTFALAAAESLTLMELILDVQDAFEIRFEESELQRVTTLPALTELIRAKAGITITNPKSKI